MRVVLSVLSNEEDFDDPRGMCCYGGCLLVVDSGKKSLIKLNKDKSAEVLLNKSYLKWPIGICKGIGENEFLISDVTQNNIVSYDCVTKEIKVYAGSGIQGKLNGNLTECQFNGPRGITKNNDTIVICDSNNNTIRLIQNSQVTDHIITKEPVFNLPTGSCLDRNGNLIICDCENHCIQKLTKTGDLSVIAGSPGVSGYVDGVASKSLLNWPYSIVCIQGNLIFSEAGNCSVRIIKNGVLSTLVHGGNRPMRESTTESTNCFGDNFCLGMPRGLCLDNNNNLYISESMNSRISQILPIDWETTLWVLTIQKNDNYISSELLPEIIRYIAVIVYTTWRF